MNPNHPKLDGQIDKAKLVAWLQGEAMKNKRLGRNSEHFAVAENQTKYIRNVVCSGIFDVAEEKGVTPSEKSNLT